MKILQPSKTNIAHAVAILREGGIVAHATETCYGLACDLSNPQAVQRLFHIKHRSSSTPVSGLFSSVEEAGKYVIWSAEAEKIAAKYYPGPITIILLLLNESKLFPTPGGGRTLGIRISSHPVAQSLASSFSSPISTTSANIHGEPNTYSAQEILHQFSDQSEQPDLLLDSGILERKDASTVIDFSKGKMNVLRQGGVSIEKNQVKK
jgi:L-threonylcarbamoyladenylate synthase